MLPSGGSDSLVESSLQLPAAATKEFLKVALQLQAKDLEVSATQPYSCVILTSTALRGRKFQQWCCIGEEDDVTLKNDDVAVGEDDDVA